MITGQPGRRRSARSGTDQMNVEASTSSLRMKRPAALAMATALLITAAIGVTQSVTPTSVHAATNNLTTSGPTANLQVKDATTGDPITEFQYIINVDNTGTTEQRSPLDDCSPEAAGYPDSCNWTSMGVSSSSPILTQGDQADFVAGLNVPDGRYLISVLADGYKLDGTHFTMPLDDAAIVEVLMQAPPLPDATIQAAVFEDISPVNGAPDLPAEHGLAGWTGVVRDTLGEVTTDVYGSPLCGNGVCLSYCYVVDGGVDIGIVEPSDAVGRCPTISDQLAPGDPTGLFYTTDERPGHRQRLQPARPGDGGHRGQDQDPEPRHEPLHARGHTARRVRLRPDDDPRGQPRLGLMDHGRRHRPRHRVRRRRRTLPSNHLRLHPWTARHLSPAAARSQASSTPSRSTCPPPVVFPTPAMSGAG